MALSSFSKSPGVYQKFFLLNGLLLALALSNSVYRDIQLEHQFPGDLRNRVVGARLQKDGLLPYTYQWKTSDGIRYFDPANRHEFPIVAHQDPFNNITASPFFHELLFPICDLPQKTLSVFWLCFEYAMLVTMIIMMISLSNDLRIKWLIVNMGILFTWTEGWKDQVSGGQLYLFNAFLMACIFFVLVRNKKNGMLIAGLWATLFVLCRPIAVVLFIPFIFYFTKYAKFILASFGFLLIYILYAWISPGESALYKNYFRAMKSHVALHQTFLSPKDIASAEIPSFYNDIEGFNLDSVRESQMKHPVKVYGENGNVFVFYKMLTHKKMPLLLLNFLMVLTVGLICLLFYLQHRKNPAGPEQILLMGFILYMIVEIFSPVHRHQYNTVQWLGPVMAGIILPFHHKNRITWLLFFGLFLNIVNFSWLPMRHTLGECCWLLGLCLLVSGYSNRLQESPDKAY